MGKNDDAPDGLQMAVKLALDVKIGRRVDYRSVIARALDFRRGACFKEVRRMIIQENTIIHGDSLTVLRQGSEPESVDAIITDPPYGINYVSQTGASIKNDKSPFIWFLYDAFRVLKSGEAGQGGLICLPVGTWSRPSSTR